MITNVLIAIVTGALGAFNSLFPSVTLPSWFTSDAIGSTVANYVGGLLGAIGGWFPVDTTLNILFAIVTLLPFIAAYIVAEWVWRHVPIIAGFGTGAG